MKEIWKDIEEYEGLYKISNTGKVKSLIKNKILKLPAQTKILPGHGSHTTIATEIATNPYC